MGSLPLNVVKNWFTNTKARIKNDIGENVTDQGTIRAFLEEVRRQRYSPGPGEVRQKKTPEQLAVLESVSRETTRPDLATRQDLARRTGLTINSVNMWFYALSKKRK